MHSTGIGPRYRIGVQDALVTLSVAPSHIEKSPSVEYPTSYMPSIWRYYVLMRCSHIFFSTHQEII